MRHNVVLAAILVALLPAAATATPSVHLQVPPPDRYGIEDLWKAIVNSDTVCNAWFEGFVYEEGHGQVFWAKTKPFALTRGIKVYGYHSVTVDQTKTAPGYEVFVTRQGTLPQGYYRFKLILQPFGVGDSNQFKVRPMSPPRLISPPDGAKLPEAEKYPMFAWTPPSPSPPGVRYVVRIVEVLPGQTEEEALRSNQPWYEGKGLTGSALRYPVAARVLDPRGRYAWQVEAVFEGGSSSVRSEGREFSRGTFQPPIAELAPLTVRREVTRQSNWHNVTLELRNNTSSDISNVVVVDSSLGFQVLNQAVVYIKLEGGAQPNVLPGTFETGTSDLGITSWIRAASPNLTIPAHKTLRVGYAMLPLLYPHLWGPAHVAGVGLKVTCKVGEEQNAFSFNALAREVNDCADAWHTADYLIVTDPVKLSGANVGPHSDYDRLLAVLAKLAQAKHGALMYFPASTAEQLRTAIKLIGGALVPDWKTNGYLLLVGDRQIIPHFSVPNPMNTDPQYDITLCDHPYSDITGDEVPELKIGRIIGDYGFVHQLSIPIERSLQVHYHQAENDGSNSFLISGYENGEGFTPDVDSGAAYLQTHKQTTASHFHMETYPDSGSPNPDSVYQVMRAALKPKLRNKDLILYCGHGPFSGRNWSKFRTEDLDSMDILSGNTRPVAVAFACETGAYPGKMSSAFSQRGAAVYVGATVMTNTSDPFRHVRRYGFVKFWNRGETVGSILKNWKTDLANHCLGCKTLPDSMDYRLLRAMNLYGDPKFGGSP